eukprot:11174950-Lingulodinium_polyedra.AAC.1
MGPTLTVHGAAAPTGAGPATQRTGMVAGCYNTTTQRRTTRAIAAFRVATRSFPPWASGTARQRAPLWP